MPSARKRVGYENKELHNDSVHDNPNSLQKGCTHYTPEPDYLKKWVTELFLAFVILVVALVIFSSTFE